MILSYKFRVYPTRAQGALLGDLLADFCELYNAGLQQRIEAYERRSVSLSYAAQTTELKATRAEHAGLARWSFTAEQQVLRRLDKSFKGFFGRIRRGAKAGFPRFRSASRYRTADFRVGDGLTLRQSGRVGIVGIPNEIKVKWHRKLPDKPKAAVALSNGETVKRANLTKRAAKELRRRQRALARCKAESKRRAKAKLHLAKFNEKIAARRRDLLHKLSHGLVNRFSDIAGLSFIKGHSGMERAFSRKASGMPHSLAEKLPREIGRVFTNYPTHFAGRAIDYEAVKRNAFRDQGIVVIRLDDPRLTWDQREMVKQVGVKLYGARAS